MAAGGLSLSSLTEEFQETKKRLKEVEEGIQKHTGRPSLQQRGPFRRHQGGAFSRLGRQLNANEVRDMGPNQSHGFQKSLKRQREEPSAERDKPMAKKDEASKGNDDNNDDDDDDEDEPPRKLGLQSLIGASSMSVKQKSRTELLNEQRSDTSGKERNKRMFGMILGTLKSFEKEETTKRKEQVDKKVEKEQKIEEMKQKEREEDIRQRRELLTEKREKITQLKKLQSKMEVVGAFEEFSKRHRYMMNFIHTAAKPPIMWLPKTHTKETEKLLARSKAKIQIIIEKEEERMLLEVERIEGITRASDGEPDEKENSHLPSSVAVVVKHEQKGHGSADANGDSEHVEDAEATDAELKNIKIVIENNMTSTKAINGDQKRKQEAGGGSSVEKMSTEKASQSPSNRSHHSDMDSRDIRQSPVPGVRSVTAHEQQVSSSPRGRAAAAKRESRSSSSSSSSSSSDESSAKKSKIVVAKRRSPSPKPKRRSPVRKGASPVRKRSPSPRKQPVSRISVSSPNRRQATCRSSSSSSSTSSGGATSPRTKVSPAIPLLSRRRSKSRSPPVRRTSPSAVTRRVKRSRSSSPRRRSESPASPPPQLARRAERRRSPSPRRRSRSPRRVRRSRSPRRRR